jgi:hypothetical protein
MSEVTWKLDVMIKDGPRVSLGEQNQWVDAYDRVEVEIKSGEDSMRVDVQPNDGPSTLRLLILLRDLDPKAAEKPGLDQLAYRVNGEGEWIPLYNQHALLGYGAFNLLRTIPRWLEFRNMFTKPAKVMILVGRNMVAEPEPEPAPEPAPVEQTTETADQTADQPEGKAKTGAKSSKEEPDQSTASSEG